VHGEYRFSPLPMPAPADAAATGGRLSGVDMCNYMESFADKFLKGKLRYETEVLNVSRDGATSTWLVKVKILKTGTLETLKYSRIVLCTGVRPIYIYRSIIEILSITGM